MTTKDLLKHRNVWMGIAMIWVIWYHSRLIPGFAPLRYLYTLGYGGVDIFLFASGIGCFLSLQKDPDPFRFLKRRFARLCPTYLCFILIWLAVRAIFEPMPATAAIGNLLGIQNLTGHGNDFNWYISALLILYLLAPLFHSMILQIKKVRTHAAVIALLVLLSVPFWGEDNLIITVTRVPVFYVGMVFGSVCHRCETLPKAVISGALAALGTGCILIMAAFKLMNSHLWSLGLNWYPFILITPGLCFAISWVMGQLDRFSIVRPIRRGLEFFGKNSFEFYLVHTLVFYGMDLVLYYYQIPASIPVWLITFGTIFAGVFLLQLLTQTVTRLFCRA